jgi:hypothetical protein
MHEERLPFECPFECHLPNASLNLVSIAALTATIIQQWPMCRTWSQQLLLIGPQRWSNSQLLQGVAAHVQSFESRNHTFFVRHGLGWKTEWQHRRVVELTLNLLVCLAHCVSFEKLDIYQISDHVNGCFARKAWSRHCVYIKILQYFKINFVVLLKFNYTVMRTRIYRKYTRI